MERGQGERRAAGIRILEAQPDLAEGLDPEQASLARKHAVAVLETVPVGTWHPGERFGRSSPAAMGLLVIDGVLTRDLRVAGRWCSELLGPGDLLRPWDHEESGGASIQSDATWNVLAESRLAVLDERFAAVACRWPELVGALFSRTARRSRWATMLLAISNLTRVDERIVALMWHLADRWGRVTREGVVVPVPLTHEMVGRLVGAHRPSVTSALGELQRSSTVKRTDSGWLLQRQPPERLSGVLNAAAGFAAALPALPSLLG